MLKEYIKVCTKRLNVYILIPKESYLWTRRCFVVFHFHFTIWLYC
ncbi:pleiotropic drug resistance protein 2-like isoform X3 [Iris pallida]|uniref:Pleiotropic drug resistance protein 2-like isoform X3 n=1 Tax=Iris pallida TaxID=29817 RepID=A0AAX6EIS3_IRIPA|nr:pleiotropic drug resistance protein 2-like isoform X3 [Iris pallida]